MSESSAVLKPSLRSSTPLALDRLDIKGQNPENPALNGPPTPRTGRTLQGREVVVGVTAPHHRVVTFRGLAVSTPLLALAGLTGLYAWASGIDTSNQDDPQAYALHWRNGLIGAAGLLAGALPALVAWGRHAYQCRTEARYLREPANGSPGQQLSRLVAHAVDQGPLTMAGLNRCIQRIDTLRSATSARACARSLAQLGQVVPVGRQRCEPGGRAPLAQWNALVDQLAWMHRTDLIPLAELKEALLSLAQHLGEPAGQNPRQVDAMARSLLAVYADASARATQADAKASGRAHPEDEQLWDRADFIVTLCGTNHFSTHALAVLKAGSDLLQCNPRAYREALPVTPRRSPRDAKGQDAAGLHADRVAHAHLRHLKEVVGRAIHQATNKDLAPVDQARHLLTIVHALASRTDMPPGAFLEGLMPPMDVAALAKAVAADRSPVPEGVDRAALIAELPRLCQLQGSATMFKCVIEALWQLPQHAYEGQSPQVQEQRERDLCHWLDVACIAANARIAGTAQSASSLVGSASWSRALRASVHRLHQPWLAQAYQAEQVRLMERMNDLPHAKDVGIQVSDFQNRQGADNA